MANDNRSSRKVKEDDSPNLKKKFVNEKGSPALVSGASDASGLRRSAREASSRKQAIPSPLSTRKSERIEKRTPTSSPIKNKAVKTQNQMMTTPLRRSDRGKKSTLSSSESKSKEPASSDIEQKKEKGKNNLEQNKWNVSKVSTSGRQDVKLGGRKRKVMDAHTYKALFKSQRAQDTKADGDAKRETSDQLPQAQAGASSHRDVDEERERPTDFPQADIRGNEGTKSMQDKDYGSDDCSGSKSAENKDDGGDACSASISRGSEDGEGDKCSDSAEDELIEESVQRASGGPLGTLCPISSDLNLGGVNGHVEVALSYSRRKLRFIEGCNEHSGVDGIKGSSNGSNDTGMVLVEGLRTDSGKPGNTILISKPQYLDSDSIAIVGRDTLNGDKTLPSKRKIDVVNVVSNSCASSKDAFISHTNGLSPSSSGCKGHNFDETCNTCSKKRRINNDLEKEQELYSCDTASKNDLGDTFISKDRGKHEATIVPAEKCDDSASRGERSLNDQGESDRNVCVTCKNGGTLRCCDGIGCKRSYHISCLEPPPDNDLPTVWHCPLCVDRIKSGIQAMPRVIESIWDTREMKMSNAEGLEKQKQYFVKYHSLAHVHNEWVAETQLKLQAPLLMEKFNQQNMSIKWNGEWTVPHRLLKKKILLSITPQDDHNEHAGKEIDYHYEWLVKWCGLDKEHATWESESASFLSSAEGQKLIREYENRHEKEKRASSPVDKIEESLVKLLKLRTRSYAHGVDNIHLSYVKRLHEFWNKGQDIIVFDDEKRIKRILLFMLSMKHVYQPFLIITSSDLISLWEVEFSKLVLSVDVKVCVDDREAQRNFRILDIYGEDGRVLFQALLFPVDTCVRDLNMVGDIRWEAVIIDDCQGSKISTLFEQIKTIPTETRILLFCGPAVESVTEYHNLLALVGSADPSTNNTASRTESVDKLKESLARFIAYDCMSDSSKFVEYWVPVYMSNVQLEQYCATLISNSTALCSCLKNDSVGALHDILISTRKCCDHPYIVDPSIQGLLTKEVEPVEYLDVGIKASGKLQILDLILSKMKTQQLRVVILFQAISGYGRDSITIGDILDDFVRQRFGQDSYERVDGGAIVQSKKQAALNNFNKKDMGRFIFLLENRACLPSIKLSSVDSVVIFNSDWNPANDLRALQKITIDSELDQIKIFRLYTPCTVEEKILVLAEENLTVDSKLQNLSRSTSDALLMWGASSLFNKLDEFHSTSIPNLSSEKLFMNNLIEEFLVIISQKCKSNDTNGSMITRVFQNWGTYIKKLPLFGEQKFQLPNGEKSHIFWRELLNGRNPQWKYLQVSTPRQRKRIHYNEELRMTSTAHDDVGKKRKKTLNNCIDSAALKPVLEEGEIEPENEVAAGTSGNYGPRVLPDERKNRGAIHLKAPLPDPQKSLHQILKPDVTKLCKILKLSESIRIMVERFLEYVIENHRVNREPATILQAFLISLCWIGASLLKHKIDKKESVALAKKHLNFSCKEEEANSVYTKLQQLKEMFLDCPENQEKLVALKNSTSVSEALSQEPLDARVAGSVPAELRVKVEIEEALEDQYIAGEDILLAQGQLANQNMASKETPKVLKDVQLNRKSKWKVKLAEMNQKEIEEFDREWNTKKKDLENEYKLEQAFIRTLHNNPSVRLEKLKIIEKEYAKKIEKHEQQRYIHLQDLKARQLATETTAAYLSVATDLPASGGRSQNELPLRGSENESQVVNSGGNEDGHQDVPENVAHLPQDLLEMEGPDKLVNSIHPSGVVPLDTRATLPNEMVGQSIPTENGSILVPSSGNGEAEAVVSGIISSAGTEKPNNSLPTIHPSVEKQIPDATLSSVQTEVVQAKQHDSAPKDVGGCVDSVEMETPSCTKENDRGATVTPDTLHADENQKEGTRSSNSSNSPSAGVLPEKGPAAQPSSRSSPTDVEFQNSCPLTCNEAPHGDLQSYSGSLAQVEIDHLPSVDIEQSDQIMTGNPSVVPITEPGSPLPTNPTLGKDQSNPPASGLVPEPPCEAQILPCTSGSQAPLELAEIPANCSDGAALKNGEVPQNQTIPEPGSEPVLEIPCEEHILPSNAQALAPPQLPENLANRSDVAVLRTNGDQPGSYSTGNQNRELHISSQTAEGPPQVPVAVEIPNQASLQPGASLSIIQESENNNQVLSRVPSHPSQAADPLQYELERLREEKENIIKFHEEMKLRLKSEYEKELAEVIAQIKSKYEVKRQEAEASFHVKRKEVDNNLGKVLMNKILADAFRSKCLDLSSSGNTGMQQVIPATFLQQGHQFSSRPAVRHPVTPASTSAGQSSQRLPSPQPAMRHPATPASTSAGQSSTRLPSSQLAMRHSSVPASTSAGQSSANQQVTSPAPVQTVNQASALLSSNPSRPLNINSTPAGQSSANQQITSPAPVQTVHQASALLSTNPSRPPNINSINPAGQSSANQQITSPAPVQTVHQASALLSTNPSRPLNINSITPLGHNPSRPLNINSITPSMGNLRVSGEIRAPAPHIRPFRPSSASPSSVASLQRPPNQHAQINLPATSLALPQASAQPLPSPPVPPQLVPTSLENLKSGLESQLTTGNLPVTSPSLPQASPQPSVPSPPPLPINLHGLTAQNIPSNPHATTSSVPQASSQPVSVPPSLTNQIAQNASNSLCVTSPSLPQPLPQPQASSQPLISTSQCEVSAPPAPNSSSLPQAPSQAPLPPLPPFSTSHSGLYSTSARPEAAGLSSSTPRSLNTRKSAMELLMDISNRIVGQRAANNSHPPPPDLPSQFEVLDTSVFETEGNARVSSSISPVETDLVCLSDDD